MTDEETKKEEEKLGKEAARRQDDEHKNSLKIPFIRWGRAAGGRKLIVLKLSERKAQLHSFIVEIISPPPPPGEKEKERRSKDKAGFVWICPHLLLSLLAPSVISDLGRALEICERKGKGGQESSSSSSLKTHPLSPTEGGGKKTK